MTGKNEDNRSTALWWIVLETVLVGVMIGTEVWIIVEWPDSPRWWDRLGVVVYAGLIVFYTVALVRTVVRRHRGMAALAERTRYPEGTVLLDRDGDRWYVQSDWRLSLFQCPGANRVDREDVERVYGPLRVESGD